MNTFILNGEYHYMWGNKLLCMFATEVSRISLLPGERLATIPEFKWQVQWADSIYFEGGDTLRLISRLQMAGDWRSDLRDKTIVAVSAGISALMQYSFNVDHDIIIRGLGILPFKSIVHYNRNMEWMLRKLEAFDSTLPTLAITEESLIILRR